MTIERIKKEIKKARRKGQWIACMLWEKRLEKEEKLESPELLNTDKK